MKRKVVIILLTLVAIMSAERVVAWGKWGHRISAYIAEQHLTEKANAECRRYLKHSLPYYASWQDYWRHCDGFQEITHWHMNYLNPDFTTSGKHGKISRDATTQIERITKEMEKGKYLNMPDSIVADNLKLLIHMVADMHCPSHVGYHKDNKYPMRKRIVINGKTLKRHAFWDVSPQALHKKWRIERFGKEYDTYTPKQIKKICKGTPTRWGLENAYKMVATFDMWEDGDNYKELPKEQKQAIEAIMHEQLAYGGYRLAAVLNKIFK